MANHASHAALPYPIKGARFTLLIPMLDADGDPTAATTPDTEISEDNAAAADCAEEISATASMDGMAMLTLSGAETDCSCFALNFKSASGPKASLGTFYPRVLPVVASGTALDAGSSSGGTIASGDRPAYDVVGCFFVTTGGTGGGGTGGANNQARKIVTYTPSTGVFTVSPNFETAIDTTTDWEVRLPEGVTLGMLRALNPATPGRTLVVDAAGLADATAVKVGPTGAATAQTAGDIPARLPAALVSGRMDSSVGAMAANVLTAAATAADFGMEIAAAVWDALTSGMSTAGSIGKKLADWVVGTIDTYTGNTKQTGDAYAVVNSGTFGNSALKTLIDAVNTLATAIKAKTDNLPSDPADASDVAASIASLASTLATVLAAVDTEVAAIKAKTDNLPSDPADASDVANAVAAVQTAVLAKLPAALTTEGWMKSDALRVGGTLQTGGDLAALIAALTLYATRAVMRGTVGATAPSTTSFTPSALSPAGSSADQFKGRIIVFDNDTATVALRGQATDITASSAAALPLLTFTALTTAPASGDLFSIV